MSATPKRFSVSRRAFTFGAVAFAASSSILPAQAAGVSGFVDKLWQQAKARGVSRRTFDAAMGDFRPLNKVLELSGKQPEFATTAADYVGKRVNDRQISTGRAMRGEWAKTQAAIAGRYGVQAEAALAIWGIETNYGGYMGGNNTVHALATLAYGGRRAEFFREELLTSLEILEARHVKASQMVGSWAGAMGHPQFMPTSFKKYAVDFNGNGHKDIWNSVPDALASVGNYLNAFKWRAGETWGYEVALPRGFNYGHVWSGTTASLRDWNGAGVTRANGKAFPRESDVARLLMPMGGHGPVFAVLPNFDVIKRYNNSDSYALAVGHLADRILGGNAFAAAWPHDTALTSDGRQKVQSQLLKRGYAIGTADGVIGPKSRAAVMDWQAKAGLLPDGHVSGNLLKALS